MRGAFGRFVNSHAFPFVAIFCLNSAGKSMLSCKLHFQDEESREVGVKGRNTCRYDLGMRNAAGLHVHLWQMGDKTEGRT